MSRKFYVCKHCGNLIEMIHASGVQMICCGDPMTELVPNTTEAANEKHLPVINVSGNTVTVEIGSVEHPMAPEHFIQWIYLETTKGGQLKYLNPGEAPKAEFTLIDDEVVSAYEYCNIHGLWQTIL